MSVADAIQYSLYATATSTVLYVADDMNELLLLVLLYADVMWLIRVYTVSKVLADFAVFD